MMKKILAVLVVGVAIVGAASLALRDEPAGADTLDGVVVVGALEQSEFNNSPSIQQAQRAQSVESIEKTPTVLIIDDLTFRGLGEADRALLKKYLVAGTTVVALNTPLEELRTATEHEELRLEAGFAPEKEFPSGPANGEYYSYVNIDLEPGGVNYAGMGTKIGEDLDIDIARFGQLTAERDRLRQEAR